MSASRGGGRFSSGEAQSESRANLPGAAAVAGPAQRQEARNVDLELATAPGDFRDAADGVLDVVRDRHAFVLSSHVSGGDPSVEGAERGRASFDLRIPAGQLSAAMGDLSDLGHVVSRTDGTHDITKRFVSDRKRIDDLTTERDTLLRQLGEAPTIAERQSIRARLRIVGSQLATARKDLATAQQRVHLVPVGVTIVADEARSLGRSVDDRRTPSTMRAGCSPSLRAPHWLAAPRWCRSRCSRCSPSAFGAAGFAGSAAARWMRPPPAESEQR